MKDTQKHLFSTVAVYTSRLTSGYKTTRLSGMHIQHKLMIQKNKYSPATVSSYDILPFYSLYFQTTLIGRTESRNLSRYGKDAEINRIPFPSETSVTASRPVVVIQPGPTVGSFLGDKTIET